MSIVLLGLNHKSAPVEIREKVALSKPQIKNSAEILRKLPYIEGIAILSTCNRTEFYFYASKSTEAIAEMKHYISSYSKKTIEELEQYLYLRLGNDAVSHLFEVSAGLDSMILGESQIQGQVQDAYNLALELGISSPVINTMFMNALSVGKRVRTETYVDRQAVSISSAAVELAKKKLGSLENRKVLILGAGETSELTARHLVSNGISGVIVANRTFERAKNLADQFGGKAVKLSEFSSYIQDADIIISCTASPHYVIEKNDIESHLPSGHKPILFIDIAVPRDIDPSITEIENVFLYDIDDLQHEVEQNLESRRKEAIKARKIIEQELEDFFFWMDTLHVVPTIVKLTKQAEKIKQQEVEKAIRRMEDITPREQRIIEQLAHSIVHQWLHRPIMNMKNLAGVRADQIDCYIQAITDLFGLEEDRTKNNASEVE